MTTYRVLVLEDHPQYSEDIQQNLTEMFQGAGLVCEVVPALCVEAARQAVKAGRFDLITVDGQLPERSGDFPSSEAGNAFIDELETLGHTGYTVFFSAEEGEVAKAGRKVVSGKPVHSFTKGIGNVSISQFAQKCHKLLTAPP